MANEVLEFERRVTTYPTKLALEWIAKTTANPSSDYHLTILNRWRRKYGMKPISSVKRALASSLNGAKGGRKKTVHTLKLSFVEMLVLKSIVSERFKNSSDPVEEFVALHKKIFSL